MALGPDALILGIETSCDETAAALVAGATNVLSSVVSSQVELHAQYGGVVPEIASRAHVDLLTPVIAEAQRCSPYLHVFADPQPLQGSVVYGARS